MLVGSLVVLLQLHSRSDRNLASAVRDLIEQPFGLIVLALFALVLATMITQAFEFEIIRLLEGYWGNSVALRPLARVLIGRQHRAFDRRIEQRDTLTLKAFRSAKLIERGILAGEKRYLVDLIEKELEGDSSTARKGWRARRIAREAARFDWRPYAAAQLVRRLDAVEAAIAEYPEPHRLLPTRLGNILRASEDARLGAGETELEGAVIRRWESLPDSLQQEHDQYRTRLDMYCSLVFVYGVLAVISPLLLTRGQEYAWWTAGTSVGYLAMSYVSYSAAIASARGYGVILRIIADVSEGLDQSGSRLSWRRTL
ncbi:hypothetical protein [Blastococcus sp. SYSU DS1021]